MLRFDGSYNFGWLRPLALLAAFSLCVGTLSHADPDPIDGRPSILDTKELPETHFSDFTSRTTAKWETHFAFLERCARRLIPLLATREVFLLARDTDPMVDALVALLAAHPNAQVLLPRLHRVIYSSGISGDPPATQRKWLAQYGLEPHRLIDGSLHAHVVDIGWRGSQPTALLMALLNATLATNSAKDARAILSHFDVHLLGPSEEETYEQARASVLDESKFTSASEIVDFLSGTTLRYAGVLDEEQPRPTSFKEASSLQDTRRNWAPTPTDLSGDGLDVVWSRGSDSSIDRERLQLFQWLLARYLANDVIRERFLPIVSAAAKPFVRPVTPSPLPVLARPELPDIQAAALPARYQAMSFLPMYSAPPALSVALPDSAALLTFLPSDTPEGRAYLVAQARRLGRLRDAKVPTAEIIEVGETQLLQRLPPGRSAAGWLREWEQSEDPNDSTLAQLRAFFVSLSAGSLYPRAMGPESVWIDSDGAWTILNSGGTLPLSSAPLAMRLVHTLVGRWSPKLVPQVLPFFSALLLDAALPKLSDASPELLPSVYPVFRLENGELVQITELLRKKDETATFRAVGTDGGKYVLKIARGDAGLARLKRQLEGDDLLRQSGIDPPTLIEQGLSYRLTQELPGTLGTRWLQSRPSPTDRSTVALKDLLDRFTEAHLFVSGLWPSHLLWDQKQWHVLGHHGAQAENDEEKLRVRYRERFQERWLAAAPGRCSHKLIEVLFPSGAKP